MIRLTYNDVTLLHDKILKQTKGLPGIRSIELLHSSIDGPFQTIFGNDLYPTDLDKIIRTGYNIIMNHPFNDGNKRTGVHIILTLLDVNDYKINICNIDKSIEFITELASGNKTYEDLIEWVKNIIK